MEAIITSSLLQASDQKPKSFDLPACHAVRKPSIVVIEHLEADQTFLLVQLSASALAWHQPSRLHGAMDRDCIPSFCKAALITSPACPHEMSGIWETGGKEGTGDLSDCRPEMVPEGHTGFIDLQPPLSHQVHAESATMPMGAG